MLKFKELQKNTKVIYIVLIFLGLFWCFLYFSINGLFSNAPITYMDYAYFEHYSWYLGEVLIPLFKTPFGFSNYSDLGYPMLNIYPQGLFWVIVLLTKLGLSYTQSMKLLIALVFLTYYFLPFWALRKFNKSEISGLIASQFMIFGFNSHWLTLLRDGLLPFLIATIFTIIFLLNYPVVNKKIRVFDHDWFKAVILLFLAVFFNYLATIICILYISAKIIINSINIFNNQMKKQNKQRIFTFFTILIKESKIYLSILITIVFLMSFWWIPVIFVQYPFISFNNSGALFYQKLSDLYYIYYIKSNFWIYLLIIIALGIFTKQYKIRNNKIKILKELVLIILICVILIILPQISLIPIIKSIKAFRFLVFIEYIGIIILGFWIEEIIKSIKKLKIKLNTNKKTKNQIHSNTILKAEKSKIIISLFLILSIIFNSFSPLIFQNTELINPTDKFFTPFSGYHNEKIYNSTTGTISSNIYYDKMTGWSIEDQNLINWISKNTTKCSRILMQLSEDASKFQTFNGHSLNYIAQITDRQFANGHLKYFWFNLSNQVQFVDDILYGKNISEYTFNQLENYLILYNIEYIIVWSNTSKNVLNEMSNQNPLKKIINIGKYTIFRYTNAKLSYILFLNQDNNNLINDSTTFRMIIKDFNMQQNKISFIFNLSEFYKYTDVKNFRIIISIHDFPNWMIYINGTKQKKINNNRILDLITIAVNNLMNYNSSQYNIEILWNIDTESKSGMYITYITSILLIYLFLQNQIKSKFKSKFKSKLREKNEFNH